MKNQNPQDILNEILLRMKYDMSKTLSENKEFLNEQPVPGLTSSTQAISNPAGYYYLPDGSLTFSMSKPNMFAVPLDYYIGVNGIKKTNNYYIVPKSISKTTQSSLQNTYSASQNLKPNPNYIYSKQERQDAAKEEYEEEQKKKQEELKKFRQEYWVESKKREQLYGDKVIDAMGKGLPKPKEDDSWKKPWNERLLKILGPDYKGPDLFGKNRKGEDVSTLIGKLQSQTKEKQEERKKQEEGKKQVLSKTNPPTETKDIKDFQRYLNYKYPTWYKGSTISYDDPLFGTYGPYTKSKWEDDTIRVDYLNNKDTYMDFGTQSDRYERLTIDGDEINIPTTISKNGDTWKVVNQYWSTNDFTGSFDNFKKNIIDKDGSAISLFNKFNRSDMSISGKKLGINYQYLRGLGLYGDRKILKGFSIVPPDSVKRAGGKDVVFKQVVEGGEFGKLGTIDEDGDLVYYDEWSLVEKTGWEEWGPTILNLGSMVIAVALPATWPLLLVSAGLDAGAAYMQYQQGDTEAAKLSAFLAVTPFISKLLVKVPTKVSTSLMSKFANAKTSQDVGRIIGKLPKEELDALKSIREFGDLSNQIKALKTNPEVANAIKQGAKKAPGIAKVLPKTAIELGAGSVGMIASWSNMKEETLAKMTNQQLLKDLINQLKKIVQNEEQKTQISQLGKMVGESLSSSILASLEKLKKTAVDTPENVSLQTVDPYFDELINYLQSSGDTIKQIGTDSSKIINSVNKIGEVSSNK